MKSQRLFSKSFLQKETVTIYFSFDLRLIYTIKALNGLQGDRVPKPCCFFKKDFRRNPFYTSSKTSEGLKTTEVDTRISQKSHANIKNPLDRIIEDQRTEKQYIKIDKT